MMAFYRVELGYYTKRGGVEMGMTVKAFGPDQAQEYAEDKYISRYPARKFAYCKISEATEQDIKLGYSEALL